MLRVGYTREGREGLGGILAESRLHKGGEGGFGRHTCMLYCYIRLFVWAMGWGLLYLSFCFLRASVLSFSSVWRGIGSEFRYN